MMGGKPPFTSEYATVTTLVADDLPTCPDCQRKRKIRARGLCSTCYTRALKAEKPPPSRTYTCQDCKQTHTPHTHRGPLPVRCPDCRSKHYAEKSRTWKLANPDKVRANKRASHARHREANNARSRDYRAANLERDHARSAEWRGRNPDRRKDWWLRTKFGITLDDFNALMEKQDGRCAICRTTDPGGRWGTFVVDHCHKTDKVRGLLCKGCNQGIGLLCDDPGRLRRAADYVETDRRT